MNIDWDYCENISLMLKHIFANRRKIKNIKLNLYLVISDILLLYLKFFKGKYKSTIKKLISEYNAENIILLPYPRNRSYIKSLLKEIDGYLNKDAPPPIVDDRIFNVTCCIEDTLWWKRPTVQLLCDEIGNLIMDIYVGEIQRNWQHKSKPEAYYCNIIRKHIPKV